jgi:hypothetical protein
MERLFIMDANVRFVYKFVDKLFSQTATHQSRAKCVHLSCSRRKGTEDSRTSTDTIFLSSAPAHTLPKLPPSGRAPQQVHIYVCLMELLSVPRKGSEFERERVSMKGAWQQVSDCTPFESGGFHEFCDDLRN